MKHYIRQKQAVDCTNCLHGWLQKLVMCRIGGTCRDVSIWDQSRRSAGDKPVRQWTDVTPAVWQTSMSAGKPSVDALVSTLTMLLLLLLLMMMMLAASVRCYPWPPAPWSTSVTTHNAVARATCKNAYIYTGLFVFCELHWHTSYYVITKLHFRIM